MPKMDKRERLSPKKGEIEIPEDVMEAALCHLYSYHPDRGVGEEETISRLWELFYSSRHILLKS